MLRTLAVLVMLCLPVSAGAWSSTCFDPVVKMDFVYSDRTPFDADEFAEIYLTLIEAETVARVYGGCMAISQIRSTKDELTWIMFGTHSNVYIVWK